MALLQQVFIPGYAIVSKAVQDKVGCQHITTILRPPTLRSSLAYFYACAEIVVSILMLSWDKIATMEKVGSPGGPRRSSSTPFFAGFGSDKNITELCR